MDLGLLFLLKIRGHRFVAVGRFFFFGGGGGGGSVPASLPGY